MKPRNKIFNSNRRKFLKALAGTMPLLLADFSDLFGSHSKSSFDFSKLGLNLGTVQNQLASDPMNTINSIENLGLKYLELPDVSLLPRLQPILQGAGFKVPSSFFPSPYITGNWNPMASMGVRLPKERDFSSVIASAKKYGLNYLVMPGIYPEDRGGLDVYRRLSDQLNQAGQDCEKAGIQLCYHHYTYEFQPMGKSSPMQVLLERLDSELVKLQADTFWLSVAGIDMQDFFQDNRQFLGPMHLADTAASAPQTYRAITLPEGSSQPIGKGSINFKEILEAGFTDTVPYYFIHLEDIDDPLSAVKFSVAYLKQLFG